MIEKNQELEVDITGYASEGQGVARVDGFVVFVPLALIGERVKIHIIKVTKSYAVGKLIEVIKPSFARIGAKCTHFGKCGGCALQNMQYESQLEYKKNVVKDALEKIGGFENVNVCNVVRSEKQFGYRNKSAFPLFIDASGKLRVCMFKGLSHNPVFIEECPLTDEINMKIAFAFQDIVNQFYNKTKKEFLYVVIRTIDSKSLVTIVSKKSIKNPKIIFDYLKKKLNKDDKDIGLFECVKKTDNNVILDGEVRHLCGISAIEFEILGIKTMVSPASFFQVNFDVMQKIYKKVNELVKGEVVVDAYSGAGLMSAMLSKSAKQVYAIEIVKEATKDAEHLKHLNNIKNLVNLNGDTSEVLPKIQGQLGKYSLVVDPPRKGIDDGAIKCICENKPDQIVYVSCNPATLARDLKSICSVGYKVDLVQPYDMFPQTPHIETLVSLKRI